MTRSKLSPIVQGNFINGEFKKVSDPNGEWIARSPGDFSDEMGKIQYSYSSVEEAVTSARAAFSIWRTQSIVGRAELLQKYKGQIQKREEEFVELLAREVGKPVWEARLEVQLMIQQADSLVRDSQSHLLDLEIPSIVEHTRGVSKYRPLGVLSVISSFESPGVTSNSHLIPALLSGNCVVYKPSEKAPLLGQLIALCFQEAGLPAGVFNLIQGEREVGRRLCVHEGVDGILFNGSYEVGARIKQDALQQHWKLLALEMGGKNSVIVWEDAHLDRAVYETLVGAFMTAGQRCHATSRIIVHKKIQEQFIAKFHARAKAFSIGYPLDHPFMGPLVEQGAVDRYMKFLGIAVREGFELVMRGKTLDLPVQGNYVTPSICVSENFSVEQSKKSVYQQTEIFAPNVAVLGVESLEEAIAQANATQYGLVTSVFTQTRSHFEKCQENLEMGLIHWNKSTIENSLRLPYGGRKKSGNHFPSGVVTVQHCSTRVASFELDSEFNSSLSGVELKAELPGLNGSTSTQ